MKKILVMLLVASMSFSLAACGDNSEVEKYKKYETLIAYMEAEDYESALAEVVEMSNGSVSIDNTSDIEDVAEEEVFEEEELEEEELEEEEPEVEAIEITLDNWQDYFEIVEKDDVRKNAFDEITDVNKGWYIVLKDGFEMVEYDTSIAIEYSYIYEMRYYEIDKENGTLTIGECSSETKYSDSSTVEISRKERCLIDTTVLSETNRILYFPTDLQIVRIQGTLYIPVFDSLRKRKSLQVQ